MDFDFFFVIIFFLFPPNRVPISVFCGLLLHWEYGGTADCDWLAVRAGFL